MNKCQFEQAVPFFNMSKLSNKSWKDVVKAEKRKHQSCPQCEDNYDYEHSGGIEKEREKIHAEAMKRATEQANIKADADASKGCSLSWTELWLHHFSKLYLAAFAEIRMRYIMEEQSRCYKKDYGDRNKYVCCYHGEFRG